MLEGGTRPLCSVTCSTVAGDPAHVPLWKKLYVTVPLGMTPVASGTRAVSCTDPPACSPEGGSWVASSITCVVKRPPGNSVTELLE